MTESYRRQRIRDIIEDIPYKITDNFGPETIEDILDDIEAVIIAEEG